MRIQHKDKELVALSGICIVCPEQSGYRRTNIDHCHKHGWVRAELCDSHNLRMQKIDKGIDRHRWEPWTVEVFNRCPDCASSRARQGRVGTEPMTMAEIIDITRSMPD
jgi:hypothetical protein